MSISPLSSPPTGLTWEQRSMQYHDPLIIRQRNANPPSSPTSLASSVYSEPKGEKLSTYFTEEELKSINASKDSTAILKVKDWLKKNFTQEQADIEIDDSRNNLLIQQEETPPASSVYSEPKGEKLSTYFTTEELSEINNSVNNPLPPPPPSE